MPGQGLRAFALVIVIASLTVGPLVATGNAGVVVSKEGLYGSTKTYPGLCRYHDAWGTITMTATAPDVYARNTVNGVREWQWVRWRAIAYDRIARRTLAIHQWSEWQRAWDYRGGKAPFQSSQWFENLSGSYPHSYRLYVRFNWWNRAGTRKVGTTLVRVTPYKYSFGGGWGGNYDACGTI
jgi:hypothetical protein